MRVQDIVSEHLTFYVLAIFFLKSPLLDIFPVLNDHRIKYLGFVLYILELLLSKIVIII